MSAATEANQQTIRDAFEASISFNDLWSRVEPTE